MEIKATLISLSKGFEKIKDIDFNADDLPCNKNMCDVYQRSYPFTYLWITSQFFPDKIIRDMQTIQTPKGHPDFIIYDKEDPNKEIYVEFKSESDGLSTSQIEWQTDNLKKERYLIFLRVSALPIK